MAARTERLSFPSQSPDGGADAAIREALADAEPRTLAAFLAREHPQSGAVILAHLDPRTAGATLKLLAPPLGIELMQRLARLGPIEPETLYDLAESLQAAFASDRQGRSSLDPLGGAVKVAALLNGLDREQSERLLASLGDADPDLAETVRSEMFRFVDLPRLDDAGIRAVLKHIPEKSLVLALKTAPDGVKEVIFRNVSERAKARLVDDLAALPKTRKSEVEEAQRLIATTVLRLIESGELTLPGGAEQYV